VIVEQAKHLVVAVRPLGRLLAVDVAGTEMRTVSAVFVVSAGHMGFDTATLATAVWLGSILVIAVGSGIPGPDYTAQHRICSGDGVFEVSAAEDIGLAGTVDLEGIVGLEGIGLVGIGLVGNWAVFGRGPCRRRASSRTAIPGRPLASAASILGRGSI